MEVHPTGTQKIGDQIKLRNYPLPYRYRSAIDRIFHRGKLPSIYNVDHKKQVCSKYGANLFSLMHRLQRTLREHPTDLLGSDNLLQSYRIGAGA